LKDLILNPNLGAGQLTTTTSIHATAAKSAVTARAWSVTENSEAKELVSQALAQRIDEWVDEAGQGGRNLGYKGKRDGSTVGLLKQPGPQPWSKFTTPTSLREVEPPVSLILNENISGTKVSWNAPRETNADQGEEK